MVAEPILGSEYAAPLLRIVRSMSLEEDIKLAISEASSPERLVAALRGSKLGSLLSPETRATSDVERAAWRYYYNILLKLHWLNTITPEIYSAYSLPLVLRDLARVIYTSLEGGEVRTDQLAAPEHPIIAIAAKTVSEYGYRGLARILRNKGFEAIGTYLLATRPERRIVDIYLDLELVRAFKKAHDKYEGEMGGEHLCYRLDLYAARAALNALFSGDPEVIRAVERNAATCLIDRNSLLAAIGEASLERMLSVLQSTPYIRGASSRVELMELYCHVIRKYSRSRVYRALAYDPTEPTYAVPVLELILLDVEDIVALSVLANIGGPRELLLHSLSIQA